MCGIVAYIGKDNAEEELITSLKNLEYRGYDSAGIATIYNNKINITKQEGQIINLENILKNTGAKIGIAHTRWATHGKPNKINAHPHLSQNKEWAVVHNGIIENFSEIKNNIIQKGGLRFISETDTEVIPMLLEFNQNNYDNLMSNFINSLNTLEGSFAICALNINEPDSLFLAKRKSPLYIAKTTNEIFVASDPICFLGKAQNYYSLNDDEFGKVNLNSLTFYDKNAQEIKKTPQKLELINEDTSKKEYPHYMLKEINEIPSVLNRIVKTYTDSNPFKKFDENLMSSINKVLFIGCGTAYHAGLMGAKYIEKFARIQSDAKIASEFRYQNPIIDSRTLCIFVSQSGETADTLAALALAKSKGAVCVALTNVLYSTLAKNVEIVLPVCAGPEIAVASTKAYNAQVAILYMLSKHLQNIKFKTQENYLSKINTLAKNFEIPKTESLIGLAKEIMSEDFAFFIGRDFDYITSKEASLKLKEITYINCEAYPSGELKHGFLALVNSGTFVFVFALQEELLDKTLNGAQETFARGARVVLFTNIDMPKSKTQFFHKIIPIRKFDEELMPIISISYFQILSYLVSTLKNINPDKPRNLAKSVTVE